MQIIFQPLDQFLRGTLELFRYIIFGERKLEILPTLSLTQDVSDSIEKDVDVSELVPSLVDSCGFYQSEHREEINQIITSLVNGKREQALAAAICLQDKASDKRITQFCDTFLSSIPASMDWKLLIGEDEQTLMFKFVDRDPDRMQMDTEIIELEFIDSKSLHTCIVASVHGVAAKFIIDTGSSYTVLDDQFARRCDVSMLPFENDIHTVTQHSLKVKKAIAAEVQIGALKLFNEPLYTASLGKGMLKELGSEGISGILGWHSLYQTKFTLDYRGKRLTIAKSQTLESQKKNLYSLSLPIIALYSSSGHPLHFAFDSGAYHSLGYSKLLERVDCGNVLRGKKKWRGAGGSDFIQTDLVPQLSLNVASKCIDFGNFPVVYHSAMKLFQLDGCFGSDLGTLGKLIFDFPSGRFDIEPF